VAVAQGLQQGAVPELLAAPAGYLAQSEDHPVLERLDERRGDIGGDGGQVLVAGVIRGVDQPLQCLADLDGPMRAGVGLGGVLKITYQVLVMPISA
jgi:hypothetical protein